MLYNTKRIIDINDILEVTIVNEGYDKVKLSKLNEETKNKITNEMINSIYNIVIKKMANLDYTVIETTKGDISTLDGFKDLEGSINLLTTLHSREKNAPPEIPQLRECLNNLLKYKTDFVESFRQNNQMVKMVYLNISAALITLTSIMISATVDFTKDTMGVYRLHVKKAMEMDKRSNLYLDSITKFNSYCASGKMDSFFASTNQAKNAVGAVLAGGATVIVSIFLIVWAMREIVYTFYYTRSKIASMLAYQAQFLRMNAATLDPDMKKVREKQEKYAKFLADMSEKIDVESKVATKKAKADLAEEDTDIKQTGSAFL
jgi:hypothetical protein